MIEIINLAKRYKSDWLFENLTLNVSGLTQLRGGNGVGKSTLLRLIAGVEKPNRGTVSISLNSHAISIYSDWSSPPEYLTPNQIMAFEGRYQQFDRDKYDALCAQFGVSQSATSKLVELSSGTKNKVNLARCLSKISDVILLDEPFNYLDDNSRVVAAAEITCQSDKDIIIVDHSNYTDIRSVISL